MRRPVLPVLALTAVVAAGCGGDEEVPAGGPAADGGGRSAQGAATAPEDRTGAPATARTAGVSRLSVVSSRLEVPWGVAFLPDGSALVAERDTARIKRIPRGGGRARTVFRVPGVVPGGEGGLLGLAVAPRQGRRPWIHAYLTTARDNRIVRFRLGDRRLRPVLTGLRKAAIHNGGRIAFGPDGKLYAGVGDAGDPSLSQDRSSPNGKILRIEPDGDVPADNPFRGSPVLSLGHRNPQGLAFDRAGRLWASEFGQNTWDEVNLIRRGRNYGWPEREGRGDTAGGRYVNPKVQWRTSEASPSGAAIVGSTLYVAALRGERLWRVPLDGARTGRPRALLTGRFGRLRTVVRAPGGALWITTSNRDGRGDPARSDDRVVRLRP